MTVPRLFPERESVALIRSALEQNGFDLAHEVLRPDYLTSPFPNLETFVPLLNQLDPALRMLMRLYTIGEAFEPETVEAVLGRDLLEASLATGLLVFDDPSARVSTAGLQLVSRLGQYFVVSDKPGVSRLRPGHRRHLSRAGVVHPCKLSATTCRELALLGEGARSLHRVRYRGAVAGRSCGGA